MRKFLLIMVIFVFVALLVACDETQAVQEEATTSESESVAQTTVVETTAPPETVAETTQKEVKKEFSPSLAGSLYISGYNSYVSVENDSVFLSGDNFKIIDAADKENPQILGSIGIDIPNGYINNDFEVKNNEVYLPYQVWDQNSSNPKESGFQIIDINDKANPQIVGGYQTKGQIVNLTAVDQFLCVGFQNIQYDPYKVLASGFELIDTTDKEKPSVMAEYSLESQNGLEALEITEDGRFAYLLADGYLRIIDISNQDNFTSKGKLFLPIWSNSLCVQGDYLYIACNNVVEIIDTSDKEKPVLIGGVFSKGTISKIFASEDSLYVTYSIYLYGENNRDIPDSGLQIYDLESLKLVGEIKINGEARDVFVSGNHAYVASGATGLQIVKLFDE